jgi:ABC-type antimicrobial peptide transport system permease subunit
MYSIRILLSQPIRFILTIGGIGLCVILILFLLGVYRGVEVGSVEYIRKNRADLWILQGGTNNILRATSILSTAHGYVIRDHPDVELVSPVLLLLSTIKNENQTATVFLTGYSPKLKLGGPPQIIKGRNIQNNNDIILDKSFAEKYGYHPGDYVLIQEDTLYVAGICSGTNAFVIQYAFVSLKRAQQVVGFPNLVTCFLVQIRKGSDVGVVARDLRRDLPGVIVFEHATFLDNNIKEMESGLLPLLYAIAAIGAVVLTVILSLILSINILERRKDFAVMKTLGSPNRFLPGLIFQQAIIISFVAALFGIVFFFPMMHLIEKFTPELSTITSLDQIGIVVAVVCIMSLFSSFISLRRLRTIYPLEAFS